MYSSELVNTANLEAASSGVENLARESVELIRLLEVDCLRIPLLGFNDTDGSPMGAVLCALTSLFVSIA